MTKIDESKVPTICYQWTCKVYCICHLPDDGSKMVQSSKWSHQKCGRGDFSKRDWLCPKCEFTETGHNPHGEHATIKDAFAEYEDGQGSTSESPTLNILISDAKLVSDDHSTLKP